MLNELNKNHMGGFENYGRDEFYNPDDTWSDTKHPIKPKVNGGVFFAKIRPKNKSCSINDKKYFFLFLL